MRPWSRSLSRGLLCVVGLVLGCSPAPETSHVGPEQLASYRAQILLPDEPTGAVGILELRARMEGTDLGDSLEDHEHAAVGENDEHRAHDSELHETQGEGSADADHEAAELLDGTHDQPTHHEATDHQAADHQRADHALAGPESSAPQLESVKDVTVVGKIGKQASRDGVEASDFPWEKGMAAFVIVDPAAEGEVVQHEHKEGEECPFCAKKKIEAQAIVQFHDDRHAPIAVDARELLGLTLEDLVVVRGDAKLVGGVLMIDANQLHIRR